MAAKDEATRPLASAVAGGFLAVFVLLFAGAHLPWLRAAFSAEDYASRLAAPSGWRSLWSEVMPLPAPGAPALWARFEGLVCVLLLALGVSHFLRRMLAPWLGKERAHTTAFLAALFLLLHPLLVDGAAPEIARGPRLALALAGIAGAFFLAGRQEGRDGRTAAALGLFLLASSISSDVAPFALLFAVAEYTSSHRHRPRTLRARTAATTLAVFGAAALLPALLSSTALELLGAERVAPRAQLVACVQTLGRLCIPAPEGAGLAAQLACGAVLLLVFQPLFRAARSAPRLWGGLFAGWTAVLCMALAWWACAVSPGARAGRELVLLVILCAGFALGASALSPQRARWITLAVALVFAPLAHAAARPRLAAGALAGEWQQRLMANVPAGGARLIVLDPPAPHLPGALAANLGWLLHPRLTGAAEVPGAFDPARVRALEEEGLLLLLRSGGSRAEFEPGTRVLLPDGQVREIPDHSGASDVSALRPWRTELGTTFEGGLDPRSLEGVEVTAELAAQPSELAVLAWSTRDGRTGEVRGSVREQRGRRVARFDLSSSLAWLLAGEVRKLSLPAGKRAIERADFLGRLPLPSGNPVPVPSGDDWLFLLDPLPSDEVVLMLLELGQFRLVHCPATREGDGRLRAHGVGPVLARAQDASVPCLWALEFRSAGQTLARLAGLSSEVP